MGNFFQTRVGCVRESFTHYKMFREDFTKEEGKTWVLKGKFKATKAAGRTRGPRQMQERGH